VDPGAPAARGRLGVGRVAVARRRRNTGGA
jgi:hypothetical protein